MMNNAFRAMVLGVVVMGLSACAGQKTQEAAVDDKTGLSEEELNAQAHAAGDSNGLQGDGLGSATLGGAGSVIYFEYDSSEVRAQDRPIVEAAAARLAGNSAISITLEGHTDERGSREYNLALGERRALSVKRQMQVLGANPDQIRAVSYGEERPANEGHDENAYGYNRRVEFVGQ